MSRLLPIQSDTDVPDDRAPRVVDLDGEDAEKVFGALSSETAREIFTSLHEEPMTASDIADAVDSSIQNVRYHLENLADAGLVEVVDTWYSSRGNEMKVYAPKDGPLIVSSDESKASRLRSALSRIVGGAAVLGAASLLVQWGSQNISLGFGGLGGLGGAPAASEDSAAPADDGGDGADGYEVAADGGSNTSTATTADGDVSAQDATTTTAEPTSTQTSTETAEPTTEAATESQESADYAAEATETATDVMTTVANEGGGGLLDGGLPPGALFFLGGMVVLLALVAYQYRSTPYR